MLIGVVGKPSSGKSTFFKAMTMVDVSIANYPFTTISPNRGIGYTKIDCVDKEFGKQCNPRSGWCVNGKRFVPVDLLDVAGLVPGSHKGEGMGLQFLSDLNMADVLIHIIDISGSVDAKGSAVQPLSYDPLNDVEFLEKELDYWYLDIIKRGWASFARTTKATGKEPYKEIGKQLSGLGVGEGHVQDCLKKLKLQQEKMTEWTDQDLLNLARELRILTKPMLIAANKIDIEGAEKNYQRLKEKFPNYIVIPCSGDFEVALRTLARKEIIDYQPGESSFKVKDETKLNPAQKQALEKIKNFLERYKSTGVQEVLDIAVFKLLKYKAIFPGGVNNLVDSQGRCLPDCFLMPEKATAIDFAFRLHTDFGNNFVKAIDVKTKLPVGREYVLKHRDVVEIMARK
ncbi:MAG TPA: redox-regulated ATPase YchF [archaeon]|nr:redox-regulated ATPase YchF [archaeon]